MDWAPSITICASTRECSWRATWTIQLTFTASVTQWPVTIWTRFSFWQCSSTRPWWQVQEHEHYLSTQQWASTCIRATFHTCSGYHCPEKYFKHERAVQPEHVWKTVKDDRGKRHTEHVLLPLLTDLFHLFLSEGVTPHLWNRVKITPLHKKGPTTSPKNYRLLAINGCIYRLFATWSGTCWQTGLLLNIKYQTLNLVSAPQGTPTPFYSSHDC